MTDLADKHCEACRSDTPRLNSEEIADLAKNFPHWEIAKPGGIDQLKRGFKFADFQSALDFANGVGALAEAEGHHPAMLVEWGKVTVSWWSHAIKGLHQNDFTMAAKTERLYTEHNK